MLSRKMMKKKYSDEDILRFLYDEMEGDERESFMDHLCTDEELWERYEEFSDVVQRLAELRIEPSELSVEKVLAFAKTYDPAVQPLAEASVRRFPFRIHLNTVLLLMGILMVSAAVFGVRKHDKAPVLQEQMVKSEPPAEMIRWDDSDLEAKLQDVRNGIEEIQNNPTL